MGYIANQIKENADRINEHLATMSKVLRAGSNEKLIESLTEDERAKLLSMFSKFERQMGEAKTLFVLLIMSLKAKDSNNDTDEVFKEWIKEL